MTTGGGDGYQVGIQPGMDGDGDEEAESLSSIATSTFFFFPFPRLAAVLYGSIQYGVIVRMGPIWIKGRPEDEGVVERITSKKGVPIHDVTVPEHHANLVRWGGIPSPDRLTTFSMERDTGFQVCEMRILRVRRGEERRESVRREYITIRKGGIT